MARQPAAAVPNVGHLKSGCFLEKIGMGVEVLLIMKKAHLT